MSESTAKTSPCTPLHVTIILSIYAALQSPYNYHLPLFHPIISPLLSCLCSWSAPKAHYPKRFSDAEMSWRTISAIGCQHRPARQWAIVSHTISAQKNAVDNEIVNTSEAESIADRHWAAAIKMLASWYHPIIVNFLKSVPIKSTWAIFCLETEPSRLAAVALRRIFHGVFLTRKSNYQLAAFRYGGLQPMVDRRPAFRIIDHFCS